MMEASSFIDHNPAALPPRKRLKSLGSSASPPSTPTTPTPSPAGARGSTPARVNGLSTASPSQQNRQGAKRKSPEVGEKEELFIFSNLPPRKAALLKKSNDSPSPSDTELEQTRKGRPGRKPGTTFKKAPKRARKEPLYCVCRQPYDEQVFMIACDVCNEWFHGECVGMTERKAQSLKTYVCPLCVKPRAAGQRRVKAREEEDEEVNVEDEDEDEGYEKENQMHRRKAARGTQSTSRGRPNGVGSRSTSTTTNARRKSIGAGGRRSEADEDVHFVAGETDSSKEDTVSRRVCANKECNNTAKLQSKYCSTECGVRVATQFLEKQKAAAAASNEHSARVTSPKVSPKPSPKLSDASPQLSNDDLPNFSSIKRSLENSPDISAADDSDLKLLESLERQRGEVENSLSVLATKRDDFERAVQFAATLFTTTTSSSSSAGGYGLTPDDSHSHQSNSSHSEALEVMDCFSCGQPIAGRNFARHIEQCYAKKESSSSPPALVSDHKLSPRKIGEGTVITYCNYHSGGGSYCAHLLASCPLHAAADKRRRDEHRLCGCPTGDFASGHCERLRTDCAKHFNWETIRKMEMQLEEKRQTQLLGSLDVDIELVKTRVRRRNHLKDDEHRTIEENATHTRQHSPASK